MPTSSGSVFRWVVPALGTAAAIALLFWLYRDLDIERFSSALANSNPAWLIVLGGTILLEQLIVAGEGASVGLAKTTEHISTISMLLESVRKVHEG